MTRNADRLSGAACVSLVGLSVAIVCWGVSAAHAQQGPPTILRPVHFDISPPLRTIKPIPPPSGPPHEKQEYEVPFGLNKLPPGAVVIDNHTTPHVQQEWNGAVAMPSLGLSFEGVGKNFTGPGGTYTVGVAPPDTEGAVGLNHYVQWVNTSFAVFSKTGAVLYGPAAGNTLWSGFGGSCQSDNDGDPIVKYDQAADRWIMAQFAVDSSPFYECIAVSTGPDPTGTWYRWAYSFGTSFNDYPKLSVWPDAYYATYNMFNAAGTSYLGAQICAYDRTKMLAGNAGATTQCFGPYSAYFGLEPSDLDGSTPPPTGSPNFVMAFNESTFNQLLLWKFHVDWTTPASSTFTGPTGLAVTSFTPTCASYNRQACIPQKGTTTVLEALSMDTMFRLAYRNMGTYESLVLNHSITGTGNSGIRWYEIRSPNATPAVYQSGTFQPDSNWRWMGSIAEDRAGDMVLGYSVSSGSMNPSIYYAGRLVGDPAGTLPQAEAVMFNGSGSQTTYNGGTQLQRWGDYSATGVDPSDGCTFWYTQEYLAEDGTFNWHTRIANFVFPSCLCNAPAPSGVGAAANGNNRIDVTFGSVSGATQYRIYRSTISGGPYTQVGTATSSPFSDLTVDGGVTYYYVVRAYTTCESPPSAEVSATAIGPCNAPPTFTGLGSVSASPTASCTLSLAWNPAQSVCGGAISYNVYRSTSPTFTPGPANRLAAALTATSFSDGSGLVSGTIYYYVVRAVDGGNGQEDANVVTKSGSPLGPPTPTTLYSNGFESGSGTTDWALGYFVTDGNANDWPGIQACTAHGGTHIFRFGGNSSCTASYGTGDFEFAAPSNDQVNGVAIPAFSNTVRLSFWHRWRFSTRDGATLLLSTNGRNYSFVPTSAIISGTTYNGTTGTLCPPANGGGISAFTGTQDTFQNTIVDLDAVCNSISGGSGGCAGQTLWIAFTAITDCTGNNYGWFLDDVQITANAPGFCSAAPNNVQFLTVRSTSTQNKIEWQNPGSGAYSQAIIRYRTDGTFPTGPTDGTGVTCTGQSTASNAYNSCTQATTPGTTYSYAAFVDSGTGLYSSGKRVQAGWPSLPTSVAWGYRTGATTLAPPGILPGAIGTGAIYDVSNDRVFHAMNPTASGGGWPRTSPFSWFPLAMNGPAQSRPPIIPSSLGTSAPIVAFLGSQDGYVYAVNGETGGQLWVSPNKLADVVQAAPAGVFTTFGSPWNLLFVGTRNTTSGNKLVCLDPSTGATLWTFDNGGGANAIGIISASASVDYTHDKVYFASRARGGGSSQTVWCVSFTNATGGACSGFAPSTTIGDIDGAPVLYQGVLYVGTNTGTVYALDPSNGHTLASYATGDGAIKGFVSPAFTAMPRRLYVATTNRLWCLSHNDNTNTGTSITESWDTGTAIAGPSIPFLRVGTNYLYAGSTDGRLYQVDVTAPASPKSVNLGSATVGSPSFDNVNGVLHVGTEAGVVYAVTVPLP